MAIRTKSSYFILAFLIIFLNVWSLNVRTESPDVVFEFIEVQVVDTSKKSIVQKTLSEKAVGLEKINYQKSSKKLADHSNQEMTGTQIKEVVLGSSTDKIYLEKPDYNILVNSGMQVKTAKILIKYVNKGGKIYDAKDLMRIYTMQESWIKKNESRLVYHKRLKKDFRTLQKAEAKPFDVNKADSTTWVSLRGIGPYYSKKIMNYREKLGGFITVDQVGETYGIKDSVFQSFKHLLYVHAPVQQIDLRKASIEDLAKHPYISWKEAKVIFAFMEQRPNIKDLSPLRNIHGIEKSRLEKMLPYLSVVEKDMANMEQELK